MTFSTGIVQINEAVPIVYMAEDLHTFEFRKNKVWIICLKITFDKQNHYKTLLRSLLFINLWWFFAVSRIYKNKRLRSTQSLGNSYVKKYFGTKKFEIHFFNYRVQRLGENKYRAELFVGLRSSSVDRIFFWGGGKDEEHFIITCRKAETSKRGGN